MYKQRMSTPFDDPEHYYYLCSDDFCVAGIEREGCTETVFFSATDIKNLAQLAIDYHLISLDDLEEG